MPATVHTSSCSEEETCTMEGAAVPNMYPTLSIPVSTRTDVTLIYIRSNTRIFLDFAPIDFLGCHNWVCYHWVSETVGRFS